MNHRVPDWHTESDPRSFSDLLPSSNCGRSTWPEAELVELLWQNGHVVMHRQNGHGRTMIALNEETKQCQKPEPASRNGGVLTNVVQEEAAAPWLQYPVDDSLEGVFSDFCYGLRATESADIDKPKDGVAEGERSAKYGSTEENSVVPESVSKHSTVPPFGETVTLPRSEAVSSFLPPTSADGGGDESFANFSRSPQCDSRMLSENSGEKGLGDRIGGEVGESSSVMTKGSSVCGSNQVHSWFDATRRHAVAFASPKGGNGDIQPGFSRGSDHHTGMHETTITSSSGGSGDASGRTGQQIASTRILRRKGVDAGDESEFQSEEAEYESMETNRQGQRSASCRRKRAAEVHNLSERRRRDRINEKMRALQELIPHCSKSDKASMLDEAIEYLKSLQLQLQLMWMGSGMAPMMFPGVHHYMSRMGMGMGHGFMPSIHGPMQFPRVPLANQHASLNPAVNQASLCSSPGINPINFQDQMQNPHISRSYGHHLGFHHMQVPPQMLNSYAYGSQLMQKNEAACEASSPRCDGGAPSQNIRNDNAG